MLRINQEQAEQRACLPSNLVVAALARLVPNVHEHSETSGVSYSQNLRAEKLSAKRGGTCGCGSLFRAFAKFWVSLLVFL